MLEDGEEPSQGGAAPQGDANPAWQPSPAYDGAALAGTRKRSADSAAAATGVAPLSSSAAEHGDVGALLAALARLQPGQTLMAAPVPAGSPAVAGAAANVPPASKRPRRAAARGAPAVLQGELQSEEGQLPGSPLAQLLCDRVFRFWVAGQPAGASEAGLPVPAQRGAHAARAAADPPAAAAAAAAGAAAAARHAGADDSMQAAEGGPPAAAAPAAALAAAAPAPAAGLAPPSPFASGAGSHHPLPSLHGAQQEQQQQQQQCATASTAEKAEQQSQVQEVLQALLVAHQRQPQGPPEVPTRQPSTLDAHHHPQLTQQQYQQHQHEQQHQQPQQCQQQRQAQPQQPQDSVVEQQQLSAPRLAAVKVAAATAGQAAAVEEPVQGAATPSEAAEHTLAGPSEQPACGPASGTRSGGVAAASDGLGDSTGHAAQAAPPARPWLGPSGQLHVLAPPARAVREGHGEVGVAAVEGGREDDAAPGSPTASEAALLNELMQQRGSSTIVDYQPEIAMAFAAADGGAAAAAAAAAASAGIEAARAASAGLTLQRGRGRGAGSAGVRVGKRKGGMPLLCPGCGEPPLSEEDKRAASKRGRRKKDDLSDPRNRKAELTRSFLARHLIDARLSLRDICFYHGHCATTVSRVARNLGMELPSARFDRRAESSQQQRTQTQGTGEEASGPTATDAAATTVGGGGGEEELQCFSRGASGGVGQSLSYGGQPAAEGLPEVVVVDATAEQARAAAQEALRALEAAAPQHTGVVALPVPAAAVAQRQRAAELAASAVAEAAQRAMEGAPMLAAAIDLATVAACLNSAVAVVGEPQRGGSTAAAALAAFGAASPKDEPQADAPAAASPPPKGLAAAISAAAEAMAAEAAVAAAVPAAR